MKKCGNCNRFILGNHNYFMDQGECKDRAIVYIESSDCGLYKKDNYFNIIKTILKYEIAKIKKEML